MMEMPQEDADALQRVVMAGMKIMYDEKTFPIFKAGMTKKTPMPQRLATEAAGLMQMLMEKSSGKIPRQILIPAGMMLLMEMGKFMKDAGIESPTPEDVDAGSKMLAAMLVKMFPQQGAPQAPAPAPQAPAPAPQAPAPAPQGMMVQPQQGV